MVFLKMSMLLQYLFPERRANSGPEAGKQRVQRRGNSGSGGEQTAGAGVWEQCPSPSPVVPPPPPPLFPLLRFRCSPSSAPVVPPPPPPLFPLLRPRCSPSSASVVPPPPLPLFPLLRPPLFPAPGPLLLPVKCDFKESYFNGLYYLASSAWCAARMASGAAKRMSELTNKAH